MSINRQEASPVATQLTSYIVNLPQEGLLYHPGNKIMKKPIPLSMKKHIVMLTETGEYISAKSRGAYSLRTSHLTNDLDRARVYTSKGAVTNTMLWKSSKQYLTLVPVDIIPHSVKE